MTLLSISLSLTHSINPHSDIITASHTTTIRDKKLLPASQHDVCLVVTVAEMEHFKVFKKKSATLLFCCVLLEKLKCFDLTEFLAKLFPEIDSDI